jgi:hypothetical protein
MTEDHPSSQDLEWARTFVETVLPPGSDQAEAGISILARLFAAKRREGLFWEDRKLYW